LNVTGFIWLEDIVEKLWRKHRVERREVAEVFGGAPHFRLVEKGIARVRTSMLRSDKRTAAGT